MAFKEAGAAEKVLETPEVVTRTPQFKQFTHEIEKRSGGLLGPGYKEQYTKAMRAAVEAAPDAEANQTIKKVMDLAVKSGIPPAEAAKQITKDPAILNATAQLSQATNIALQAKMTPEEIQKQQLFDLAVADFDRQVAAVPERQAEFRKQVQSGKIGSLDDIYRLAQSWGYIDWVAQERDRLRSYELVISNLARQFAKEMAATQAKSFSMTSVTQQLTAITEFVEEKVKEMENEKKKKEGTKEAEPESKVRRRKAKKKEAEELLKKIEEGKQIETPVESKLDRMKLYDEVKAAERAKDGLDVKELINEPKFQEIYEEKRDDELRGVLKGLVPEKVGQVAEVMKSGQGGQKVSLTKYDIAIQTALVSAYRKSLEEYAKAPKAG